MWLVLIFFQGDPLSDITECVFDHVVITKQYDVYRSVNYPKSLPACSNHSTTSTTPSPGARIRRSRQCHGSWYLGVSKDGSVRVVKSTRRLPPPKSFFYQSWVHKRTPGGSSQLPPSHPPINALLNSPFAKRPRHDTTTVKTSTRVRPLSRNKVRSRSRSRPAFPLLSGFSRNRGNRVKSGLEPLGADCGSNLLSSCRRNRITNKTRRNARLRLQRRFTTPPSGTEP